MLLARSLRFAERAREGDLHSTSYVRTGQPFHEITFSASLHAVDLIVIGTHGCTGAQLVLLGSTAERGVRHTPSPVLAAATRTAPKRLSRAARLKLKTILVPIDFSKMSKTTLPWAILLAAHLECGHLATQHCS